MSKDNSNLIRAFKRADDEFYTRYEDIEAELRHYERYFGGKKIICNCNDYNRNFHIYFSNNFRRLSLKELVVTKYVPGGHGICHRMRAADNLFYFLKGDGNWYSPECLELMDGADIVVTNPPFKGVRFFLNYLLSHEKKFIILAPITCLSNHKISAHACDDTLFPGWTRARSYLHRDGTTKTLGNIYWFQNIAMPDIEPFKFKYDYNKDKDRYKRYSNYDAINVDRTHDIPDNYYGLIGVPLTAFGILSRKEFDFIVVRATGRGGGDLLVLESEDPYETRYVFERAIVQRRR